MSSSAGLGTKPRRTRHGRRPAGSRDLAPAGSDPNRNDDEITTNTVDQVTSVIREAIVRGQYGPGERLKVAEVAQRFGFSAMPIREALRKLEGEGVVQITAYRGATVKPVDRQFIADLYDVRTSIEFLALRRAIERMTLEKLAALDAIRKEHEAAVLAGDIDAALEVNRRLHITLFEIAGNAEATRLFERSWEIVSALRHRFGYGPGRLATIVEEHRLLLDALRRADLRAAKAVIRMHNQAGLEDLMSNLE
jgi:DNA-binding GntR family transcriptional regulator